MAVRLLAFAPTKLAVDAGTTVRWQQQDVAATHTVTSGTVVTGPAGLPATTPDGRFESGRLTGDAAFTFRFTEPGTYPYFCSIHPATMRGEVRVRGVAAVRS